MDINWKKLSKTCRPYVAMPVHDGRLEHESAKGLLGFKEICITAKIEHDINFLASEALVSRARNNLVASFMSQPEKYTHLIFVDSDMEFEGAHVFQLLNYDLDVVSGLASKKVLPLQPAPVFSQIEGDVVKHPTKNLIQADVVGGAFLCIKRSVIKKMTESYPELKYKNRQLPELDHHSYGLFDPINEGNKSYGEDNSFCKRWQGIGGKIWVDPKMSIGHIGRYNYKIGKLIF